MDLLASLDVEDLPEQQTRMLHLVESNPDFQLNLGFDACCACGALLADTTAVPCRACRRVLYCSEQCRSTDANAAIPAETSSDDEPDTALGHTSVLCALLSICNDDEAVEDGDILDTARREAAVDRVRSEYESYPATLANMASLGPCYQEALRTAQVRQKLTIHVIGASEDAELSQGKSITKGSRSSVCKNYAEALAELADKHRLTAIELLFIGPDCPIEPWNETLPLQSLEKHVGTLTIRTVKGLYQRTLIGTAAADLVVLFNPGYTCPDYAHWNETLATIPAGTPFLSTTNTEMEGIADCQYLLDQDKIQTLPPGLADIFGVYNEGDDGDNSFFAVNPFAGSRVRQNGTMANDLFVKNRWMLGGVFGSFDPSKKVYSLSKKIKSNGFSNKKSGNPALI